MERSTLGSTPRWMQGSKVRLEGEELYKADGGLSVSSSSQPIRQRQVIITLQRIANRRYRIQLRSTGTRCMAGRSQLTWTGTDPSEPDQLTLSLSLSLPLAGLWITLSTTTPTLFRNRKLLSETWLWTSHLLELWSDSLTNGDADG